jgi:uncharacterized damage-inducible protein DinB
MREAERISTQMKQAFWGDAWHGQSVTEVLENVDSKKAFAKPVTTGHSIWEIVLHLKATQDVLVNRIQGVAKELTVEEDWPPVSANSEADWKFDVSRLVKGDEELREKVANFPDDLLDVPLVNGGSSAYNNFHGYVQHTLYHLAQIGLLSTMIDSKS